MSNSCFCRSLHFSPPSNEIMCGMIFASQGKVIGPCPGKANSSSDGQTEQLSDDAVA